MAATYEKSARTSSLVVDCSISSTAPAPQRGSSGLRQYITLTSRPHRQELELQLLGAVQDLRHAERHIGVAMANLRGIDGQLMETQYENERIDARLLNILPLPPTPYPPPPATPKPFPAVSELSRVYRHVLDCRLYRKV